MARKEPRQAVSRAAAILWANKRLPCRITNVSRGGAMLLVKNPDWLPRTFDVMDTFSGKKRRASVAWVEGNKIGVRFHAAADLVPDPIRLGFGKRQV
jgi:PilZ domain-containing protein